MTPACPRASSPEAPTAEKALKAAVREAQTGQRDHLVRLGSETNFNAKPAGGSKSSCFRLMSMSPIPLQPISIEMRSIALVELIEWRHGRCEPPARVEGLRPRIASKNRHPSHARQPPLPDAPVSV